MYYLGNNSSVCRWPNAFQWYIIRHLHLAFLLSKGGNWSRPKRVKWSTKFFSSYLNLTKKCQHCHYTDVIMSAMSSQITSPTSVYSTVYSGVDQRKHQSSASLAFVRGIHRWPVNSPHKKASNAENVSIWWRHHDPVRSAHLAGFCFYQRVLTDRQRMILFIKFFAFLSHFIKQDQCRI